MQKFLNSNSTHVCNLSFIICMYVKKLFVHKILLHIGIHYTLITRYSCLYMLYIQTVGWSKLSFSPAGYHTKTPLSTWDGLQSTSNTPFTTLNGQQGASNIHLLDTEMNDASNKLLSTWNNVKDPIKIRLPTLIRAQDTPLLNRNPSRFGLLESVGVHSLRINSFRAEDSGTYECWAQSLSGERVTSQVLVMTCW